MTIDIDPELATVLAARMGDTTPEKVRPGDWRTFRENIAAMYPSLTADLDVPPVEHRVFTASSADGAAIDLHWYAPRGAASARGGATAAVVHAHGGGLIAGEVSLFAPYLARYVAASGVPFLSVEYRLVPEVTGTKPGEDVFAGLTWLVAHAAELGVDPTRIAVMGESAGGGVAAATALRAREAGIALARQVLIYPQLDDRNVEPDPALVHVAADMYTANRTSWDAILGEARGTARVPATVAVSRLTDHSGLPPAYLEVGSLDILRDETVAYATRLWSEGIEAELHVLPGLVHGWDHFAPTITLHSAVHARRVAVLRSL